MDLVVVMRASALRCAICHDALAGGDRCGGCGSCWHPECRATLARCPTLGCAPRVRVRPRERRRWALWASLATELAAMLSVALGALALLASLVAPVMTVAPRATQRRLAADFRALGDALDLYEVDNGRYPDELSALWENDANRYLKEDAPLDPWGTAFVYARRPDGGFELLSYGADGAPGGVGQAADRSSLDLCPR